jgi:hypothetical protein
MSSHASASGDDTPPRLTTRKLPAWADAQVREIRRT